MPLKSVLYTLIYNQDVMVHEIILSESSAMQRKVMFENMQF